MTRCIPLRETESENAMQILAGVDTHHKPFQGDGFNSRGHPLKSPGHPREAIEVTTEFETA